MLGVCMCHDCKELSDEYLKIRELLNAWNTNTGGQNRFEVTRNKLISLINLKDKYEIQLQEVMYRIQNTLRNE